MTYDWTGRRTKLLRLFRQLTGLFLAAFALALPLLMFI